MNRKNQNAENDNRVNAKHSAPHIPRIANGGGQRNSSIELLRIIAMFMILAHHFIVQNGYKVENLPLGPERIFFQLVMISGGKIGVVIFFSISAWFFLDKEQTIKSNLKRVWIMERELLFWSLTLMAFYFMLDRDDLGIKLIIKSFAPLTMNLWWYATAYAIFLVLLPFLSKGLKALGREYHLALVITVLAVWGLTSFIPDTLGTNFFLGSSLTGVFGFIYLFILISAYKWYLKPFTTKQIWLIMITGIGLLLLYTIISIIMSFFFNINHGIYVNKDWKLPVILIGFSIFLLFNRVQFSNPLINHIAQSAFAVYLITEYDISQKIIFNQMFNLKELCQTPFAILQIFGILFVIYSICTLLDFIRQILFAVTIDRKRGYWFELIWSKVSKISKPINRIL